MSTINDPQPDRPFVAKVRLLRRKRGTRVSLRQRVPTAQLKKGIYLIPSLFTTGNLICGFFSIISTFNGEYLQAAVLIILAHLLDGMDGYVARLTKTTTQFGVEFDSLADLISFGLAPAILVYYWALVPWKTWGWLAACLYVVCGALRLARFNVQIKSVEKSHFVGLPTPAAAEMIVAIVLMYFFLGGEPECPANYEETGCYRSPCLPRDKGPVINQNRRGQTKRYQVGQGIKFDTELTRRLGKTSYISV